AGVNAGLTIGISEARAVARQAAGRDKLAPFKNRRNGMSRCQCNDLIAFPVKEWVRANQQPAGPRLSGSCGRHVDVACGTRAEYVYLLPEIASGILNTPQLSLKIRIG